MNKTADIDKRFDQVKFEALAYLYKSVMTDFVYKSRDMKDFYEQIQEMVPWAQDFFVNWFKGFCAVAEFDFDEAQKLYCEALKYADSAEQYIEQFLQQGFALFMYLQKKDDGLKFWDYGVKNAVFNKESEKLMGRFNVKEQFWLQFPPLMFKDKYEAELKVINDYKTVNADKLAAAVEACDFKAFEKLSKDVDFNSRRINDVSVLYYAVQKKGVLLNGEEKFVENLVHFRTMQLFNSLDLSKLSNELKSQEYFTILHQIRITFEKSGLGRLMYEANNGRDEERKEKLKGINSIIHYCVNHTDNCDEFVKHADSKTGTSALLLACEYDDSDTVSLLLKNGSSAEKAIGYAKFGMNYSDGSSVETEIPNSLVYRLINFKAWETLKLYLTEFAGKDCKTMTDKSEKCNITPLVYFILCTIYSAETEEAFNLNKALVDGLIPLFLECGAVLEENTAFGTAKQLLGMK